MRPNLEGLGFLNEEIPLIKSAFEVATAFPKKQVPKRIPVLEATKVIADWWEKNPDFYWGKDPAWVMLKMIENSELVGDEEEVSITYHRAVEILDEASTVKMISCANNGMNYFKEQWKRMYL